MQNYAIIAGFLGVALAGCATGSSKIDIATAQAQQEKSHCPTNKGRTAQANCLNEIDRRLLRPLFTRPDLIDLFTTTRLALAIRVDKGEMRPEEADVQLAQLASQMTSEMERQNLARRSVAAQEAASGPVTCTQSGSTTICF